MAWLRVLVLVVSTAAYADQRYVREPRPPGRIGSDLQQRRIGEALQEVDVRACAATNESAVDVFDVDVVVDDRTRIVAEVPASVGSEDFRRCVAERLREAADRALRALRNGPRSEAMRLRKRCYVWRPERPRGTWRPPPAI